MKNISYMWTGGGGVWWRQVLPQNLIWLHSSPNNQTLEFKRFQSQLFPLTDSFETLHSSDKFKQSFSCWLLFCRPFKITFGGQHWWWMHLFRWCQEEMQSSLKHQTWWMSLKPLTPEMASSEDLPTKNKCCNCPKATNVVDLWRKRGYSSEKEHGASRHEYMSGISYTAPATGQRPQAHLIYRDWELHAPAERHTMQRLNGEVLCAGGGGRGAPGRMLANGSMRVRTILRKIDDRAARTIKTFGKDRYWSIKHVESSWLLLEK